MSSEIGYVLLLVAYLIVAEAGRYPENPFLDWLCMAERTYPRHFPWDCSKYIICQQGHAFTFQCPAGQLFSTQTYRCDWPNKADLSACSHNPLDHFDHVCKWNSKMKLSSQKSCSQYFDCSQSAATANFVEYLMECPYPQLFSDKYQRCMHYSRVHCGERPIPMAPCDYAQYQQICFDPKRCTPCHYRHPSCVGRRNGINPVQTASSFYMYCQQGRTSSVHKCSGNHVFSPLTSRCTSRGQNRRI